MFDSIEASELYFFIIQTHAQYQSNKGIIHSMQRKEHYGKYDHDLAPKAWICAVNRAAKDYVSEHGTEGQPWNKLFSKTVREEVADALADYYLDHYDGHLDKSNLKICWKIVKDSIIETYGKDDIPAINEAFNNWMDSLHKDCLISDWQLDNVTQNMVER